MTVPGKISVNCNVKQGFTLIEFLVVLGILAIAVGSALLLLTSVLRGTNQANITAEIKQNGQAVLDALEGQIHNAKTATGLSGTYNSIQLTLVDGSYLWIGCFGTVANVSNGWIGTYTSTSATPPTSQNQYTALTNRHEVSGVDVVCDAPCPSTCSLSVINASVGAVNPAIVKVSFTVNQGVAAPSRQDFKANAKFETTISLRKY